GQLPRRSPGAMIIPRSVVALSVFFLAFPLGAAEVTTNGTGGGSWNDPTTWRGGAVPKGEDEVTIRKGDAVVFDRSDDGQALCAKLLSDPESALVCEAV